LISEIWEGVSKTKRFYQKSNKFFDLLTDFFIFSSDFSPLVFICAGLKRFVFDVACDGQNVQLLDSWSSIPGTVNVATLVTTALVPR
jgi:hypothetical protein